jgi:hypothetical protein
MSPDEALRRAEQARQVLETPIVADTLDFMEKELHEAWIVCPVRDTEGRETLWRMAVTARKFRDLLRGTMESGKLALDQIKHRETFAERAKKAIQSPFRR